MFSGDNIIGVKQLHLTYYCIKTVPHVFNSHVLTRQFMCRLYMDWEHNKQIDLIKYQISISTVVTER